VKQDQDSRTSSGQDIVQLDSRLDLCHSMLKCALINDHLFSLDSLAGMAASDHKLEL
jgi:hypothetical protein